MILQDDEEEDGGAESELDESESEADVCAEEEKQRAQKQEKNNDAKSAAPQKYVAIPVIAPVELKGYQKTKTRSTEEVLSLC